MDRGKPLDSSGGRPEFPPGDAAAPRLTSELPRSRQGSRLRGHVAASPPRSTASPLSRHEGLAKLIRDMARIAHERPCRRYRRLSQQASDQGTHLQRSLASWQASSAQSHDRYSRTPPPDDFGGEPRSLLHFSRLEVSLGNPHS